MVRVRVRPLGAIRRYLRDAAEDFGVEVVEKGTVVDLLEQLGLDESQVWLIVVVEQETGTRAKRVDRDYQLSEGDEVTLLPYVAGG